MAYKPSNPNGQATMANSEPVVIASNQSAVPVSAASLPLPSGAATAANQSTANTALSAIQTAVQTLDNAIAGNEMQVDVITSALPTGAATAANQSTIIGHLDGVETALGAIETAVETIDNTIQTQGDAYVAGATQIIAGIRQDTSGSPSGVADGDVHPFIFNEEGRLKVSAQPAIYTAVTGTITGNGQNVSLDVSRASNIMFHVTGTFSTVNCTFEGSIDGGTTWFVVQAVRSNANTIETTTGNLSSTPTYAWEASVNALTNFRVRSTAYSSGTQTWRFLPGAYATEPIPAAQVTGTQPVSGTITASNTAGPAAVDAAASGNPIYNGGRASTATPTAVSADNDMQSFWVTRNGAQVVAGEVVDDAAFTTATTRVQPVGFFADETATDSVDEGDAGAARMTLDRKQIVTPYAHTAGGATPYRLISAASTNATSVKASAGQIYSISAMNTNAAVRYLKLYNMSSAPTVGTSTPVQVYALPPSGGITLSIPVGMAFSTGIALATTTGAADSDTGAVAANEIVISLTFF